jgi:hypothetical protein
MPPVKAAGGINLPVKFSDIYGMRRKMTITIDVDPEAGEITVRDDGGNARTLRSIMLFGGDASRKSFYIFGWGASADAAWAYKQGFAHAVRTGDASFRSFYKQCACHIVQLIAPEIFRREVEAEKVLDRWEDEDRGHGTWQ